MRTSNFETIDVTTLKCYRKPGNSTELIFQHWIKLQGDFPIASHGCILTAAFLHHQKTFGLCPAQHVCGQVFMLAGTLHWIERITFFHKYICIVIKYNYEREKEGAAFQQNEKLDRHRSAQLYLV